MEHDDTLPHDYYRHQMHHEKIDQREREESSASPPVESAAGAGRPDHIAASSLFANAASGLSGAHQRELAKYWQKTITDIETRDHDFKSHALPLARIKKVMKADEDVKMISAEAPILFAKGCEIFITELTMRAWIHAHDSKRRTLARSDIANAISRSDMFDFLIDIVPREEFVTGATGAEGADATPVAGAAGGFIGMPLGHSAMPLHQAQPSMQQHSMPEHRPTTSGENSYYAHPSLKHDDSHSSTTNPYQQQQQQQQHHSGQMFDHNRFPIPPSPIVNLPTHQSGYLDHTSYGQNYHHHAGQNSQSHHAPQLAYGNNHTNPYSTHGGVLPRVLPGIPQQQQQHHMQQSHLHHQQQQQQQHGRQGSEETMQGNYR